jgi:protein involved in polysaccharide export with SLBB domain
MNVGRGRIYLRALLVATFAGPGLFSNASVAQTLPNTSMTSASDTNTVDRGVNTEISDSGDIPSQVSLSASQIISILQNRPELMVEIKDLLAQMQHGDTVAQADSITDQMAYTQIISDKDLRQNITIFLRARGYVNDDDLQRGMTRNPSLIDRQVPGGQGGLTSERIETGQVANAQVGGSLLTDLPADKYSAPQNRSIPSRIDDSPSPPDREANTITSEPPVLRRAAPYNLASLRDLYTQIPDSSDKLKRFGSEAFVRRDRATVSASAPLDMPIGPDYVLGPGDSLTIDLWGGISQTLSRVVSPDGHLSLPEAGDIQIAGLTLEKAQGLIQEALKKQYRNVQVSVMLSKLRTIRVYVVGDVQRPGAYEISSLGSALSALYAAGGPTAVGSLRILKHYRGTQLIGAVDLYDFLLRGVRETEDRLQAGDTLAVPAAGPQVAIWGAVKRPAIYELKDKTNLATLFEDAGGLTVAASLEHISVERIDANQLRETISIGSVAKDRKALSEFEVQDGDRIRIAPIAPNSERVVYLEGHVLRPGRHPYHDGMRLSELLQSYQDLLPEPAAQGEIVRLVPPDLHVETIDFNVPDVLIGNGNLLLRPFDTVRVLGRYDVDAPKVDIEGEVLRPGSYPLSEGMTVAQLVRMAGGFKRDALVETADLISYQVVNGTKIESQRSDVRIGDAVDRSDSTADRTLKAGDVLTIHQITGWNDIGASITIEGEVAHPGNYGFLEGERLSDVLRRTGGFRETAYPAGAVLIREQVRELEEKSRVELVRQIETSAAAARLSPNISTTDQSGQGQAQLIQQQQEQILSRLKSQPATGRLVIHISSDIDSWAGTSADVEVRRGDVLRIPKRPGFVLVSGQVYNASAITFVPGKSAGWYLQHAGGSTSAANRKEIFVIRANGSVVGRRSAEWYEPDVLSTHLEPGDVVVVPQKIIGASLFWRNLLSTAQIASSIAITAAVAGL